jgi:hypothetical protein
MYVYARGLQFEPGPEHRLSYRYSSLNSSIRPGKCLDSSPKRAQLFIKKPLPIRHSNHPNLDAKANA